MRMEKGTFDDSGLTVKDFKLLKEFYQTSIIMYPMEINKKGMLIDHSFEYEASKQLI